MSVFLGSGWKNNLFFCIWCRRRVCIFLHSVEA